MSLMSTLAKVAIGVAMTKGVGGLVQGARQGGGSGGGLFGGARAPQGHGAPGGLENIMRDVLAGTPSAGRAGTVHRSPAGGAAGGLGGLLEELAGGAGSGAGRGGAGGRGGGLDDMLGSLVQGGALGGLLGGLAGAFGGGAAAAPTPRPEPQTASFGEVLNQSLRNSGEPDAPPAPHQEAAAALMLRAMIQAAKADGKVDEGERAKLLGTLKDASPAEMDFVKSELAAAVDIEGLAAQVPKGLAAQVYAMSVMAITLDDQTEAAYLNQFAAALGMTPADVNGIHAQLGVPPLYA